LKRLFLANSPKIEILFFGLAESNYTQTQTFYTMSQETPFMPQFYFKKHFPNLTQEEYDEFTQRWVDERRYEEIDDIVRDTFAQWKNDAKEICVGCGENVGEVNLTKDYCGDLMCENCFEEPEEKEEEPEILIYPKKNKMKKKVKNFLEQIEESDISSKVEATKDEGRQSETQNRKGNRLMVRATYYGQEDCFKIPDGLDLEDETVVKSWGVSRCVLHIHYVDGKEEHIYAYNSIEADLKYPQDEEIVDIEDCGMCDDPYDDEE
jgi:hypothetical protein